MNFSFKSVQQSKKNKLNLPYSPNFQLKRSPNGGWQPEQNVRMAIHFSSPRQKLKHYIHIRVTMILDFLKRKDLNRFTGSISIVYFFSQPL